MIDLATPPLSLRGQTIFRDHADPDLFYYLPGIPRLVAEEGRSAFTLYKWRRDLSDNPALDPEHARGAGIALFETTCDPDLSLLAGIKAEIGATMGRMNVRLVPAPFRRGKVRTIIAPSEGMVDDLVVTELAPLFAPWHAAFSLALNAEGARLFELALGGERLPIGVAYEWEFDALLPALHADVRMDYERIYTGLEVSVAFQFTYGITWRAELDLVIKKLIEEDAIRITIISFQDDEDQRRQHEQVMDLIRARVESGFFRSSIPVEAQSSSGMLGALLGSSGNISSSSGMFVLKARYEVQEELKISQMQIRGRAAVTRLHVSTGILSSMLGEEERLPVQVSEIDTDDPWFSRLEIGVRSAIAFEAMPDLVSATLQITYGSHIESYAFDKDSAVAVHLFQSWLTAPDQDSYELQVQYDFDPTHGGGPVQIRMGPQRSRQRQLVLNPLVHLHYRRLDLLLGPGAHSARVSLRVPGGEGLEDLAKAEITLDLEHAQQRWSVRAERSAPPLTILAKSEWTGADGATFDSPWAEVEGDSLVVLGPFEDVLRLTVEPSADWSAVTLVIVALQYTDGDYVVDRELRFSVEEHAGQRVEVPLRDSRVRSWRWRQVLVRTVGPPLETDWIVTDNPILIVGVAAVETAEVRVRLLGAFGEALGVIVELFAYDPRSEQEEKLSLFFRPGELDRDVRLPLDEGALRYRFVARRIMASGEEPIRSGESEAGILLLRI